jgi:putative transposase
MYPPASRYEPSPCQLPNRLPPLEDPTCFEVRYVSANGGIHWHHQWVTVSHPCIGAYVGLEDIDDGIWMVYFGPLTRGRWLERHRRI